MCIGPMRELLLLFLMFLFSEVKTLKPGEVLSLLLTAQPFSRSPHLHFNVNKKTYSNVLALKVSALLLISYLFILNYFFGMSIRSSWAILPEI